MAQKTDTFTIEIMPDGMLRTLTDPISQANHQNAAAFLKEMDRLAGGEVTISKRTDTKHSHHHVGDTERQAQ